MMAPLSRLRRRRLSWALLALLPALWLHLLIPAGFMPARGAALSLEICPEGFPAGLLAHAGHHHHPGGGEHGGGEHCVFGVAGATGPPSQQAPVPQSPCPELVAAGSCCAPILPVRLVYLSEARGPPPAV
jgi:hypothetical protein